MKKLGIELFFKPLCFKNAKALNNNYFSFGSIKKVKDPKQPQIKKE